MKYGTFCSKRGEQLAYQFVVGASPTVVFLNGFRSDMRGGKSTFVRQFCVEHGLAFATLDYSGHGLSGGDFLNGTVSAWKADAEALIELVNPASVVYVGASMGAWIGALLAAKSPVPVKALIGIGTSICFADELFRRLSAIEAAQLEADGLTFVASAYGDGPYPITRGLLDDAQSLSELGGGFDLTCPIRLIHGLDDPDVPWARTIEYTNAFSSRDVRVSLIKGGGHRLSSPRALEHLRQTLREVLAF